MDPETKIRILRKVKFLFEDLREDLPYADDEFIEELWEDPPEEFTAEQVKRIDEIYREQELPI